MSILSRPLTYADLERARDATNDRVELIDGVLYVTPAPKPVHQEIIGELYTVFRDAVRKPGLGRVYLAPVDVRLAENSIVQPDLMIVFSDRLPIVTDDRIEGAPSLVVEIVSPSSGSYDRTTKRDLYALHGIPEYWVVDPQARAATIYSDPQDGRYRGEETAIDIAISATIPGLSVALKPLFAFVFGD